MSDEKFDVLAVVRRMAHTCALDRREHQMGRFVDLDRHLEEEERLAIIGISAALDALEKLATHVRPTCTELYDEAVAALARVRSS